MLEMDPLEWVFESGKLQIFMPSDQQIPSEFNTCFGLMLAITLWGERSSQWSAAAAVAVDAPSRKRLCASMKEEEEQLEVWHTAHSITTFCRRK